jgi:O-antigen ligase
MVAMVVGSVLLFSKRYWQNWLRAMLFSGAFFLIIFSSLSLIASSGRSFGLEMLGLRIQSIAAPQMEESSLSRLVLLPRILEVIKYHPFSGVGLGSTLVVYSPVLDQIITTPHYDWGYLEIFAELGAIGMTAWLILLSFIYKNIKKLPSWQLTSLTSLLVINITSPALFHVFGIIWLTILIAERDRASVELLP